MGKAFALRPARIVAARTNNGSAAGTDPIHVANDHMGVVWTYPNSGGFYFDVDLGAAMAVDTALFFGCTGASLAMDLFASAADDGAFSINVVDPALPGGDFLAGSEMPSHGRGVALMLGAAPVVRRWWRFSIFGAAPGFSIARIAMGERLQLNRNFGFGAGFGLRDLGQVDFSSSGVLLRRRAAKLRTPGLTFPAVHKDEIEGKVQPLIELCGGQEPIALVTDPDPHPMRQRRCYFGPMIGDLGTVWPRPNGWEWRANLIDLVAIP